MSLGHLRQARSILVNFGVICGVSKLYKTENCTKEKNIGCLRGGSMGGGKGGGQSVVSELHKREQH